MSRKKKLKLKLKLNSVARGRSRRLGLAPVARGALGLRIGLRARGRSGYPERCEAARAVKIKKIKNIYIYKK